jgi:hypothetical protein
VWQAAARAATTRGTPRDEEAQRDRCCSRRHDHAPKAAMLARHANAKVTGAIDAGVSERPIPEP